MNECEGNMIQSCAIHLLNNNMTKIVPFVDCMESYRKSNQAGEIVKLNPIYLQKVHCSKHVLPKFSVQRKQELFMVPSKDVLIQD